VKAGALAEPPLVGRKRELEELESFLNLALNGKGKTVFVSGEAGSGKTRLANEFLNAAINHGVAVMTGWCLSDAQVPYFPFVEAFNTRYTSLETEQPAGLTEQAVPISSSEPFQSITEEQGINAWLTASAPNLKTGKTEFVSPQVWKDQLFAGVAKTLHTIAAQTPLVLLIEDIQWADSASLALLHYIARAIHDSEKILVLATYRKEDLISDIEGRSHPLTETMRMMRREELFAEIELSRLARGDVSRIAENMIGGSIQPELVEKLATESNGNPLFVVESLRMLHERKSLVQKDEKWCLAVEEIGVPRMIKDIILRRLACLKYAQRRVLDAASVIGVKFDVELLREVLGMGSLEALETLNVVAHSTSLVNAEENWYKFDHARTREVLYEELAVPLKKWYHSKVAERLERNSKLPFGEIAYHYEKAGNEDKAAKFALKAGQAALEQWSDAEAIKHFSFVLKVAGENPKHIEERLSALEGLGDAFYANSMFKESTKVFEDLAEAAKTGFLKLRAYRKAMESAFQYGNTSHLLELTKKSEPYAAESNMEKARIAHSRGRALCLLDKMPESLDDCKAALRIFEEEYSLWDAASAMISVGLDYAMMSMPQKGLAQSLRAIALFRELGDYRWQMEAYWVTGIACGFSLLLGEEAQMHSKIIEIDEGTKMGNFNLLVHAYVGLARSYELNYDFLSALQYTLKALDYLSKTDSVWAEGRVYMNLWRIYSFIGDLQHAEVYLQRRNKLPVEIDLYKKEDEVMSKAVFCALKKEWKESNHYFEELFKSLGAQTQRNTRWEIDAKSSYAWALERQGLLDEAKVQRREIVKALKDAEEEFEHANLHASFMVKRELLLNEEFELRKDLVNVGRKPAFVTRIGNLFPANFEVTVLPPSCSMENGALKIAIRIAPFHCETLKVRFKAIKVGSFAFEPEVVYLDDLERTRTFKPESKTVNVREAQPKHEILPERLRTGYADLDALLLGGIPKNYAVVLTSLASDEREQLVDGFLEAGAAAAETVFDIVAEGETAKALAEKYPANFSLFICNPGADSIIKNMPNVCRLKGVENLTDVDIALAKAFRTLNTSITIPRRICIEILSDVLLLHHAVNTRRWLGGLLSTLKLNGFTILAVLNPQMHPQEEVQAILDLFDGEILLYERTKLQEVQQILRVNRMHGQRFLKTESILNKEKLS